MKGIRIFLADGFEDVEALGTCDVLRRGGVKVELVSIEGRSEVASSHGIKVQADCLLEQLDKSQAGTGEADWMIFPGGLPGSQRLADCAELIALMNAHYSAGGSVAAICAAPGLVLSQLEADWNGRPFTCFESFQKHLLPLGAKYTPEPAVRSGRIVTGRSAGHALSFGLEILSSLNPDAVADVRHGLFLD